MAAESLAEALTNSVSLCMWLVNGGRYFFGYNLLLKKVNLWEQTLLFGMEQTLPLCEGQCQTSS